MKTMMTKLVTLMALAAGCLGAQTASAAKVAYAVLQDGVLTFSYGEKPTGDNVYSFHGGSTTQPPWYDERESIISAVFDESMQGYKVGGVNFYGFFNGCLNMISVTGLNRLDVSGVSNMGSMFNNCQSLVEIDISRWSNAAENFSMASTFCDCKSLTTIYVSSDFTPTYKTEKNSPFNYSTSARRSTQLTGGNGTVWSGSYMSYLRAVIDKTDQQGYFTGRAWIDVELGEGTGVAATSFDLTTASIAASQTVEMGVPTRAGYVFDGWQLPAEQVSDGVTTDARTGNITVPAGYQKTFTVTALWEDIREATFAVDYYLGETCYTNVTEAYKYSETQAHVLAFTNPVVDVNYAFAGWYANSELTGEPVMEIAAGEFGDKAFYAKETLIGPTNLIWNGSTGNDWTNGRNWTPNKVPTADDDVTFAGSPNPVRLVSGMAFKSFNLAGDVVFDVPEDYEITFVIGGTGNITKIGAGKLTVSSANTYVGTLMVREGRVLRKNAQAFGLAANALVVTNATLELGGWNNNNVRHALTLEEGGVVDVSGNLQGYSGLSSVALKGDASVRCDTEWATSPTLCNGAVLLGGHVLTKVGDGSVRLQASSWSEADTGTLFVQEGRWQDTYKSSVLIALTNMVLKLSGTARYYESQSLAWGRVLAENTSLVTHNTSGSYYLGVREKISGGLTATMLHLNDGCVYEPLVAGDCLTVSNAFDMTKGATFVIDVSKLDRASLSVGSRLPLLVTPTAVSASRVSEVRTFQGRWPIYTKLRDDGMYELGVVAKFGGCAVIIR